MKKHALKEFKEYILRKGLSHEEHTELACAIETLRIANMNLHIVASRITTKRLGRKLVSQSTQNAIEALKGSLDSAWYTQESMPLPPGKESPYYGIEIIPIARRRDRRRWKYNARDIESLSEELEK